MPLFSKMKNARKDIYILRVYFCFNDKNTQERRTLIFIDTIVSKIKRNNINVFDESKRKMLVGNIFVKKKHHSSSKPL